MKTITYRLNPDGPASATYYRDVADFTDDVLAFSESSLKPIATAYRRFLIDYELEDPRSIEEYVYELINLGVLWRAYGDIALSVKIAPYRLLASMSEWRKKHQKIKPFVDFVRGILMSLFLAPIRIKKQTEHPKNLTELGSLITWLDATGDFREDALRYVRWIGYLGTLTVAEVSTIIDSVLVFADWFEEASTKRMGLYTPKVDEFIRNNRSSYLFREDRFSCLRSRTEYHLNMIGAEIMNRAFRQVFQAADRKTVLVPGCMRLRPANSCEGLKTHEGVKCSGCESTCRVNQLRQMGTRQDFDVVILPHSSDLSRWASKPGDPSIGVVGVACLSVLVQGGWELKRFDVPAQCVLLNYCGCKKHWDDKGIPTELDLREIKRILTPVLSPAILT